MDRDKDAVRIELSPQRVEKLKHHKTRTGIGSIKLLSRFADNIPSDLTFQTIDNWISGSLITARKDQYDYVARLWANLPDAQPRVPLTPDIVDELDYHRHRTGIGPVKILSNTRNIAPDGLDSTAIRRWLKKETTTAQANHLEFVLSRWRDLPDQVPMTTVTRQIVKRLRACRTRTGVGASRLLASALDVPDGLTLKTLSLWYYDRNARLRAPVHHLAYVFEIYDTLMDAGEL